MEKFETTNSYNGANFVAENGACRASGDFRFNDGKLANVNINGSLTKEGTTYAFSANRDDQGNVNIYNVHDYRVIKDVATVVAGIIESIEELNTAAD